MVQDRVIRRIAKVVGGVCVVKVRDVLVRVRFANARVACIVMRVVAVMSAVKADTMA